MTATSIKKIFRRVCPVPQRFGVIPMVRRSMTGRFLLFLAVHLL